VHQVELYNCEWSPRTMDFDESCQNLEVIVIEHSLGACLSLL
jgi:hypothetical protein